jgi:hypothetical protein
MCCAHQIARQTCPRVASYREALAYGLKGSWACSRQAANSLQPVPAFQLRSLTPEQIAASRAATRLVGALVHAILSEANMSIGVVKIARAPAERGADDYR